MFLDSKIISSFSLVVNNNTKALRTLDHDTIPYNNRMYASVSSES